MLSLERQQTKNSNWLAERFYVRRFFRIYPLSAFAVLLVTAFAVPQASIPAPGQFTLQPLQAGNLLSNLALMMNVSGHTPILGQLWSLPLEVQMYLLLPPIFWLARRTGLRGMLALWCCAAILALGHYQGWLRFPGSWRFSLLRYIPDFVPGVIAYTLWRARPRLAAWLWMPWLILLCGSFYGLYLWHPIYEWPLCLAVGITVPLFQQVRLPWLTSAAHQIAKYSYGVYLGHTLCLWLAFHVFHAPVLMQAAAWIVLMAAIPVGAYYLLEAPCIGLGIRLSNRIGRLAPAYSAEPSPLPVDPGAP